MAYQLDLKPSTTALVVDDHTLTREMVRSILRGIGFQNVLLAESGQSALELLQEKRIDLVICDWNMPNGSGIELLRLIRQDSKLKDIPFLMLTAEAYRESVVAAAKAGVTDYIAKPFTADALAQKVAATLKTSLK